jgi:hypothetical protein
VHLAKDAPLNPEVGELDGIYILSCQADIHLGAVNVSPLDTKLWPGIDVCSALSNVPLEIAQVCGDGTSVAVVNDAVGTVLGAGVTSCCSHLLAPYLFLLTQCARVEARVGHGLERCRVWSG